MTTTTHTKPNPPVIGALQYAVLRFVHDHDDDSRPVAQIDCHRAVARFPGAGPAGTYNAIRRMRDRGLVELRSHVPDRPQATRVRITDLGLAALRAEQAKMTGAR